MVRIRMLTSVSGRGFSWDAGQEIDLPGAEASIWADGVRAEYVEGAPEQAKAEKATPRSSGGGRGRRAETRG